MPGWNADPISGVASDVVTTRPLQQWQLNIEVDGQGMVAKNMAATEADRFTSAQLRAWLSGWIPGAVYAGGRWGIQYLPFVYDDASSTNVKIPGALDLAIAGVITGTDSGRTNSQLSDSKSDAAFNYVEANYDAYHDVVTVRHHSAHTFVSPYDPAAGTPDPFDTTGQFSRLCTAVAPGFVAVPSTAAIGLNVSTARVIQVDTVNSRVAWRFC